jgi:hypothetical protein
MMHTIRFANEKKAPPTKEELSRPSVVIDPDVPGLVRYFAHVATADDVEYEFAVAAIVNSFSLDPELARAIIDTLTRRARAADAPKVRVTEERDRIVVQYEAPADWSPQVSRVAAQRYFVTIMAAVKSARELKGRVSEADVRAARAEAKAQEYAEALDRTLEGEGGAGGSG